jgi:hypothetical protein
MRRFAATDRPTEWSPSWQSRWAGCGGPAIILFPEPGWPPLLLLRRVLALVVRRPPVLLDRGRQPGRGPTTDEVARPLPLR